MSTELIDVIVDSCSPEGITQIDSKHTRLRADESLLVRCGDLVGSVVCLDIDDWRQTTTVLCRWQNAVRQTPFGVPDFSAPPWVSLDEVDLIKS